MKEPNTLDANIEEFIKAMDINRMYELKTNSNFKWAMIEHNEYGYCWTVGYKGICTTIYSTDTRNNIKYWKTEADAKIDLIKRICTNIYK